MKLRFTFCLCERRADTVVELAVQLPSVQDQKEKCGGALSPVCPGGSHVCVDRTPAASPKPSSQMPGSYCFSPFGCPARRWSKDRYLHWRHSKAHHLITTLITTLSARHIVASQFSDGAYQSCTKLDLFPLHEHHVCLRITVDILGSRSWQNVSSYKCLPPCFLLSSPFWSPFFGCSLGLWGCCEIEANIRKMKQNAKVEEKIKISKVMIFLPW